MSRGVRIGLELAFAALVISAIVPIWLVDRPPIQDLPQHLAAIRVIVDHGDPALRFAEHFDVELWRTQYLGWYLLAWILAPIFGVVGANLILMSIAIAATPYALRFLLRELGRDEGLALFALPLTWNAHLVLGFMNFVAAIPIAIVGIALALRLRRTGSRRVAVGLGLVAIACFYMHVVPFGFLGLGAGLVAIGDDVKKTLARWAPLVPATIIAILWMRASPAGRATVAAASGDEVAQFMSASQAIREIPMWLTDVLPGEQDDTLLAASFVIVLLALALGTGGKGDPTRTGLAWRVGVLSPIAAIAYFVAPASYGWIWPINARFPLLALIFAIPVMPSPRRWGAPIVYGALAIVSVLSFTRIADAFVAFDDEVGELDEAIAVIPEGSRVAGLIYDRHSRHIGFAPFIHSVAWVQVARGGAVMFTFADFDQSPIRFRESARPPRVPPRWEWTPERVVPSRDLEWYDYVLVRGGPGRIGSDPTYEERFRGPHGSVWERRR